MFLALRMGVLAETTQMATQPRSPSRALRAGRRALEGQRGIELLHDWQWEPDENRWFLTVRLTLENPLGHALPHLPAQTNWCVVVSDYPQRAPEFLPAKDGGITATFPHQTYNGEGRADVPWRKGNLCLDRPLRALGRSIGDDEPLDENSRLLWRSQRALAWLNAADRGELVLPGEPWELPDIRLLLAQECSFAFAENDASLALWQDAPRSGKVEIGLWNVRPNRFFVHTFLSALGEEVYKPRWGTQFRQLVEANGALPGVWLRLDRAPIVAPYAAPLNWSELREAATAQNLDLKELLYTGYPELRNGQRHLALIGFPIPRVIGGPMCQMHWQALQLPPLSRATKGFRPEKGATLYDRAHALRNEVKLDWIESANWDIEQLASRGRLGRPLTDHKVLLIGAGALGSAVAEMLVRAGVHGLTIADGDIFRAGNLVRHTLTLQNIDESKAVALAARLNQTSPQAEVRAVYGHIPRLSEPNIRYLQEATLVVDCTGDDALPEAMEAFDWKSPKQFVSCSLGWGGQRMWFFSSQGNSFDAISFSQLLTPWLLSERQQHAEEMAPEMVPREGIGCWHPVFPARIDDVWLLAAIAVKQLDKLALDPPLTSQLTVWEQTETGVCRVDTPPVQRSSVSTGL